MCSAVLRAYPAASVRMEYGWITAHSYSSETGRPIAVSPPDSPYAHPFRAIAARLWENLGQDPGPPGGAADRRAVGPRVRSDARLYYPKGAWERDSLRRGIALKEALERRAHRLSLRCR